MVLLLAGTMTIRKTVCIGILVSAGLLLSTAPASAYVVSPSGSHNVPTWVRKADSHVRISRTHIAHLISTTGLSATTISKTKKAIVKFNKLPLSVRKAATKTVSFTLRLSSTANLTPQQACAAGSYIAVLWWGVWTKLSECLTRQLHLIGNSTAAFEAFFAATAALIPGGQVVTVILGFMAGSTALVAGLIDLVDGTECGYNGIAIYAAWSFPTTIGC